MMFTMLLLISGCAANNDESMSNSLDFYEQTHNYHKMIDLYKAELKKSDSTSIRTKLANTYLLIDDYESSLFTLVPLLEKNDVSSEILSIKAKALYKINDFYNAQLTCETILANESINAEIENMMGLIHAENNRYEESRLYFNRARTHFHDDTIIQNNLAVLDLFERKPQAAISRLTPLYRQDKNDIKIKSNLLIAFAQIDDVSAVRSILMSQYSQSEIDGIIAELLELKL
ncbi:hypothetical protein FR932_13275 [Moritella marina ATCC 15381]|uniref:Tetratricopeptide repeat protein n=2 Tax=Moritella marina TaxID=90736 RepID=A0A5J6WSD9_MORMI|nr:hypothetical protein FR932_13275 [Moritella marina ATCC 15381]